MLFPGSLIGLCAGGTRVPIFEFRFLVWKAQRVPWWIPSEPLEGNGLHIRGSLRGYNQQTILGGASHSVLWYELDSQPGRVSASFRCACAWPVVWLSGVRVLWMDIPGRGDEEMGILDDGGPLITKTD